MRQAPWQVPSESESGAAGGRRAECLSDLTPRSARELFLMLDSPDVQSLTGCWDGRMVGRRWLRAVSTVLFLPTPARGWCGKEIAPSGEVTNLVRRRGARRPSVKCSAKSARSVVDGRLVVVADYSQSGPPPVSWLRGEIRWLVPGEQVLGLLMLRVGQRAVVTMPFHMVRRHATV